MPVLPVGKLPAALLRDLLGGGSEPGEGVLVPPMIGEDAGVVGIAGGALVAATDPITLTGEGLGAHAVIINANDVAVMGVRPKWFLVVLLLPVGTTEREVRTLFQETRAALADIGASLLGGHSEVTPVVTQPVVIGQMLGYREDGYFVQSRGMREGDVIVQVGPAPVEGAAVLAAGASERLSKLDSGMLEKACRAVRDPGICVVEPAMRAAELGATAMHDPTEGGLSAGLHELAEASGLEVVVDPAAVLWFEPGLAVAEALGADPWGLLASGTLLAAFPADQAERAAAALGAEGYATALIGRVQVGRGVRTRAGEPVHRFEQDEAARLLS